MATGVGFPDALGGAPAAALRGGPVLLSRDRCLPVAVAEEIARLRPRHVVVLGGPAAVGHRAAALLPCGTDIDIPLPVVGVDRSVTPTVPAVPAREPGGPDRPLAAVRDARGTQMDFVADELVVMAPGAELGTILARSDGIVVATNREFSPPTHLVRVGQLPPANPVAVSQFLRDLDPRSQGRHVVSSDAGLRLLAFAARSARDGMLVSVNGVGFDTSIPDRDIADAASAIGIAPYDRNAFTWGHLNRTDAPAIGVTEAWRALALAGRLPTRTGNRVPVAVIDGGFAPSDDYPPGTRGASPQRENRGTCSRGACPWHGVNVAHALAAVADNGIGAAGVAGPVARLDLIDPSRDLFGMIDGLTRARNGGNRVVNMSSAGSVPGAWAWTVAPLELTLQVNRAHGIHHVASAGNDGARNVNNFECFLSVCWETDLHWPCELDAVLCVGGLAAGTTTADPDSSWGPTSVRLWAPYTVFVGPDPGQPVDAARIMEGTSMSSPYVVGVIALMLAADPALRTGDVEEILLATARRGTGRVTRRVDAYAAVIRALGGTEPPEVAVTRPTPDQTVRRAQSLRLTATVSGPAGAGPIARWLIDGTPVATGLDTAFGVTRSNLALGAHTVTAEVRRGIYSYTRDIPISVENTNPVVTITQPRRAVALCSSCTVTLRATSYDPDEPDHRLADRQVSWATLSDGAVLGTGHALIVTGRAIGPAGSCWDVRARGTDSQGAVANRSVNVCVDADPPVPPPSARITAPGSNQTFWVTGSDAQGQYTLVDLVGTATDPHDGTLTGDRLVWTTSTPRGERTLGLGASLRNVKLYWKGCGIGENVHWLRLTATNSRGASAFDQVLVTVNNLC